MVHECMPFLSWVLSPCTQLFLAGVKDNSAASAVRRSDGFESGSPGIPASFDQYAPRSAALEALPLGIFPMFHAWQQIGSI